jgi:hypothetical protein
MTKEEKLIELGYNEVRYLNGCSYDTVLVGVTEDG